MKESSLATSRQNPRREFAADTLSMVSHIMTKARTLQQRTWLLPAALGLMTLVATPLVSAASVITGCWMRIGPNNKPASCSLSGSGKALTIISATSSSVHGQMAAWFTGKPQFTWSIGNSTLFWVAGVTLSIAVCVVFLHSSKQPTAFAVTYILAGLVGVCIILASTRLTFPSQLSHLLAVSLIICIAGFTTRSKSLELASAVSFFVGIVLSRHSQVLLPGLDILLTPVSQAYIAASVVLIVSSITLYLRARSLWSKRRYCTLDSGNCQMNAFHTSLYEQR